MIAAYWDDCYMVKSTPADPTDSRIYYKLVDADTFVVTYANLSFFNFELRTKRMTFQVVLRRNGTISINYKYMDNWDSASAGIQSDRTGSGKTIFHKQSGTTTVGTAPPRKI